MPSRNNSSCSSTSFVTGMEAQQCHLSKHQWQRLDTDPRGCPKISHKHLLKTLHRYPGAGRIILTKDQMQHIGLQHLCWDGYIEVGEYFYRPALPPALKQGMVAEIRCIGIDPCTEKMTLTRIPALKAKNIDLAWRGADPNLIAAVFTWSAPLNWEPSLWPRLTKNYKITVLETIPDPPLTFLKLKTGTVMRRDKEGCIHVRFEGHKPLVQLGEQQAAHIQVSEPSCPWKIATLDSPTTAIVVPCRRPASRQHQIPLTTVRWMLAQQEKWCKIGITCDFRADVDELQKQQKLESLAETFDLQRPELLHAANTCVHPDVTFEKHTRVSLRHSNQGSRLHGQAQETTGSVHMITISRIAWNIYKHQEETMTQKLSNNATAELMEDLGSRVLPASTLPHDKEHQGGGSAPGHSTVISPTSVAATVTIELRPSATELSSTTVMYQRPVKVLPPWEQLLKAHYRSTFHRPGIGYNHFRQGIPTGREWICVGKNLPPKSYNQREKSLKQLLSSSAQKWNSGADWTDNVVAFSRRQWETLGVQHISYNSTVEVGGYFFQPRALSHKGFIAAADGSRKTLEAATTDDDKENTAEGDEAANHDDSEETADGGQQSAETRQPLPALDPDHASNPEAPVQHLNRLSRALHMAYLGTGMQWHGDGVWRWCDGRAAQCEEPLCEDDDADGSGTCTPIHTDTAATVPDAPMRRTRSGLVNASSEPRSNMATLKAVAAALQPASLLTRPVGQRRKREGSPGLMTGDRRKAAPAHQQLLSTQKKPTGSSHLQILPSRGLTADNDKSSDVECTGAELSHQALGEPQTTDLQTCYICQGTSAQESIMICDGRGCSVIAHLNCYFSTGSKDANDTISDIEHWHCENCGGLPRHMHPRPRAAKTAGVSFDPDLEVVTESPITEGVPATGHQGGGWGGHWQTRTEMPQLTTGKGKEAMEDLVTSQRR